ncbi:molybdopterin-guanine dinucleotide biosynthesis protein B [Aquincola sp. S2]|uniref:Molybdopterin-guanine dinucleotide biosynthesis protein B n=1 Tax=Pseudaquabacterium terrae TaxID=2732868 RepID=A0ABX2EMW9_9BURK|nr:molybdopterin-guanine dinucleotide biosynthesis protein B [Aquabacterium terrae]NRF69913.1 molybdopterin-guanine dinucleotide biosynthesis protein B [Aquabacterium terrae]
MHVVGFCGTSGVGKTTLIEQLIAELKARGLRVSVIKHAHHAFDIDTPGKDSWRHRQAGAFEVLIASGQRLAKMREYEVEGHPTVHQLIAELIDCDWVLVEGYKHADIPKIEVWRAATGEAPLYPDEPYVVAIATDAPAALPVATARPVFDMAAPAALASHLLDTAERFHYRPEIHG